MVSDLLVGAGIVTGLLWYFAFQIKNNDDFPLKLMLLIVGMSVLVLVPKTALDNQDHCEIVKANQTAVNGTITSYEYSRVCFADTKTTDTSLFTTMIWLWRSFLLYIFIKFAMWIFNKLKEMVAR